MKSIAAVLLAFAFAGCSANTPFYRGEAVSDVAIVPDAAPFENDPAVVVLAKEFPAVETSMAISPRNPDNAVVASMGYHTGQRLPFCDAHFTRDGGRTWQRRTLERTGTDGVVYDYHSDPAVGVDANGTYYYATMLINRTTRRISMAVSRSDDGGDNWTRPVNVTDTDGKTVTDDKEWLAVDDTTGAFAGNVYMMWGRYYLNADGTTQSGEILFSRSTDRGATWGTPIAMTARVRGVGMSMIAVGPNGEVHAVFNDGGQHWLRTSTDGGVTFAQRKPIPVRFGPGGKIPNTQANFSPMQTFAVDRSLGAYRGSLYYFMPTGGGSRPDGSTISAAGFWYSRDGGTTWQGPRVLSAPETLRDAVFPMVAVDQTSGEILTSWLDRRDDAANTLFRVYASRSTDGGATFEPSRAFTSPFSLDRSFLGHYLWNAAQSGRWITTFTDANGTMSIAHLELGQTRPTSERKPKRRSVR